MLAQVLAEAKREALLELTHALARDAEAIAELLEREGLVVRERSKEDRRVVYIRLTSKGKKLAEEIPVEPMEIFRSALEALTAAETRELMKILGKVARRVRQTVKRETGELEDKAPEKEK